MIISLLLIIISSLSYWSYRQKRFIKIQRKFINDLLDIEQVEIICRDLNKKIDCEEVKH